MKKLIYICFVSFFFLIIVSSNTYKTNLENYLEPKKPIGFAVVLQSEFIKVKSINALTVQLPGLLPPSELKIALKTVKSIGLTLIGRTEGRSKFQTKENKIDFEPHLQTIPLIAAYEYPAIGENLPSVNWIREVGLETLEYDNFDGIIYRRYN